MNDRKEVKKMMKNMKREMTKISEFVVDSLESNPNDQTAASDADLHQKISEIMSGERPPPESYDDGDQSPLSGERAQFLRNQWASGMDYAPYEPMFRYLSPWLKVLYCGDYDSMVKMLENGCGRSNAGFKLTISGDFQRFNDF